MIKRTSKSRSFVTALAVMVAFTVMTVMIGTTNVDAFNTEYTPTYGKYAEACKGENGKTTCNKPGDQTGKEITIHNYSYAKNKKYRAWKFVVRCTDSDRSETVARNAEAICLNDNIGYDQKPANGRDEIYKEVEITNYDFAAIQNKCETSCTPMALCSLKATGLMEIKATKSASGLKAEVNRVNKLYKDAGMEAPLKIIILKKSQWKNPEKYLKRGDIICTGTHTAVML